MEAGSVLVLRRCIGDIVIVALFGNKDVHFQMSAGRGVKCPHRHADDPQTPQKPRRTFAEDWYQLTAPVTINAALATSVEANTWPDDLRQATQWQTSGPFNAAST